MCFRTEGNCLENVIWGHMDAPIAVRLQREFDALRRAHGEFRGFHHWANAPSYDTDYRQSWMDWLSDQNGALVETHFLTSSRIVKMGLSVANIAYSQIRFGVHENEESYLRARAPYMTRAIIPKPG
ncbi:Hypothetical protein A7982_11047 [Minicystis rosea]|nr:Hypothetical protein A7982_11047 [Minicystis rosea]